MIKELLNIKRASNELELYNCLENNSESGPLKFSKIDDYMFNTNDSEESIIASISNLEDSFTMSFDREKVLNAMTTSELFAIMDYSEHYIG